MTKLSDLFTRHGSDKNTLHSYGPFYDDLLSELQAKLGKTPSVLEFGIGEALGSGKAFSEFVGSGNYVAVDKSSDLCCKLNLAACCRATQCDQSSPDDLASLTDRLCGEGFDLIIDDCSHRTRDQLFTLAAMWSRLNAGGVYVIEDVQQPEWFLGLPGVQVIDYRANGRSSDDVLVVLRKGEVKA